jgi:hypothetical protein
VDRGGFCDQDQFEKQQKPSDDRLRLIALYAGRNNPPSPLSLAVVPRPPNPPLAVVYPSSGRLPTALPSLWWYNF